jgi:hypothetical protein
LDFKLTIKTSDDSEQAVPFQNLPKGQQCPTEHVDVLLHWEGQKHGCPSKRSNLFVQPEKSELISLGQQTIFRSSQVVPAPGQSWKQPPSFTGRQLSPTVLLQIPFPQHSPTQSGSNFFSVLQDGEHQPLQILSQMKHFVSFKLLGFPTCAVPLQSGSHMFLDL